MPAFGSPAASSAPTVLSVSQLTGLLKGTLESTFSGLWVGGEISEVARPQSGHLYFTLKDADAQIRGVMWRSTAQRLRFNLEDGQQVICLGDLDIYPPRGSYQLVVRPVEPQGLGALQIAFRQLQQKLAAEGLFDPRYKKPLPRFPRRIAFVTSPTGAAVRDFLEVANRRFQGIEILVIPARVQGTGAAAEIARGIELANQMPNPVDVLVVGRGGGSLEDLWCFNEEAVVRAIFASRIPVVSAVGHEIDVTLADLVADVRALTPSEAAERVVPSADELLQRLAALQRQLVAGLRGRVAGSRARLDALATRRIFRLPAERVHQLSRRLDELDARSSRAIAGNLRRFQERIHSLAGRLESLSPLAVLSRGYSVTQHAESGNIVRSAEEVQIGELLQTRLHRGNVTSRVEDVR
jgi:exodeoxyribonuclease VII large subunit